MEIPGTEFLTLDWIIRSIRLTTVCSSEVMCNFYRGHLYTCVLLLAGSNAQLQNCLDIYEAHAKATLPP